MTSKPAHRTAAVSGVMCLALLLLSPPAYGGPTTKPADARIPVPKSLDQQRADKLVHEKFAADYADRDLAARLALSRKLREAAAEPALSDATRFVMLREARERAIEGGDLYLAFSIIDEVSRDFAIDPRELKVSAMSAAIDKTYGSQPDLFATYLRLASEFIADGDVDMARKATQLASDVAKNLHDAGMKARANEADKALMEARKTQNQVIEAAQKLKKDPSDGVAAQRVGVYLCVVRERWSEGLPLLAKSADSRLRRLAEQELASPTSASAMAELADGWWSYAEGLQGPPAWKVKTHAAEWYKRAVADLSGGAKATAQSRIDELKR